MSTHDPHDEAGAGGPSDRDEALVLSVAFEPAGELAERVFGLDDGDLRRVVALTLEQARIDEPVEVSVLLTNDDGLRTLNRDYRGRDEPTDVLSFPLLDAPLVDAPPEQRWQPAEEDEPEDDQLDDADLAEDDAWPTDEIAGTNGASNNDALELPEEMALPLGDIAISRDAVARQAAQAGHSPAWELAYLLAHGVLHLIGYDDHTESGYQAMVAHQEAVLARAGIAR